MLGKSTNCFRKLSLWVDVFVNAFSDFTRMLLSSFLSFSLLNIDWFLGFMWLDGQNIFGRRVRLVGQATKSETDHAGWVPWRLSTFTPHISFLFDSKYPQKYLLQTVLSKIVRIEFKPVFSNWHYMPFLFSQKCCRNWLLQLRKTVFRHILAPRGPRISLANIPVCNNNVTQT